MKPDTLDYTNTPKLSLSYSKRFVRVVYTHSSNHKKFDIGAAADQERESLCEIPQPKPPRQGLDVFLYYGV